MGAAVVNLRTAKRGRWTMQYVKAPGQCRPVWRPRDLPPKVRPAHVRSEAAYMPSACSAHRSASCAGDQIRAADQPQDREGAWPHRARRAARPRRRGDRMRRRAFITLLGGAAAVWPLAAGAQQPQRTRLVGILMPFPESDAAQQTRFRAFRQELTKLGWSEGSDVQFDVRWTTDNMGLVRTAATDLVQLKPDVIVTVGDRIIPVLTQLTRSIPIVAVASDFLGSGFVESLARPGGNVTGFSLIEFSVIGKVVETLKQMAPGISRVGIIYNPDNPVGAIYLNSFKADAAQLAVQPIDLPVHGPAEIERAIARLAEQPNGGFITPPDLTIAALATEITTLAARYRVPAIYSGSPFYVRRGGLASYGPDIVEVYRRQASYVDRVLRGEKPSDLPIQQPTNYQLVINLKTAKALGLEVPPTLLARADEVIE